MSEIDDKLIAEAARQKLEDQAAQIASATARPGALADVFAIQQDIKVGKYSVRPFYDLDFEILQELEHPFASFAVGNTTELEGFVPRGPKAWELFYVLTTPLAVLEDQLKVGGAKGMKNLAKEEFSRYQLGALFKLYEAVVKQLTVYASSVVGYTGAGDEKKDAKGASNVPPS